MRTKLEVKLNTSEVYDAFEDWLVKNSKQFVKNNPHYETISVIMNNQDQTVTIKVEWA